MARTYRWLLMGMILIGIVGLVWLAARPTLPPTVTQVAVVMPLGIEAGQQIYDSAALALAESDMGDRVSLAAYDTRVDGPAEARAWDRTYARQIAADPSIVAVLGAASSASAEDTIPIYNEAGLALVSPLATAPHLTKPGYRPGAPGIFYPTGERTFFRTIPSDEVQGQVATRWLAQNGIHTVFIIALHDDPYSSGLAGIFEANIADADLALVGRYDLSVAGLRDKADRPVVLARVVNVVRQASPDAVYVPLVAGWDYSDIVIALREALPELTVMSGDGLSYEQISPEHAEVFEGVLATTMPANPTELDSATAFVAAYEAAYGITPPGYAMTSYDAMQAILQAVGRIPPTDPVTRGAVLTQLQTQQTIEGAQGNWHFSDTGDIQQTVIRIIQFTNGEWTTLDVIQ